MVDFHSHILPAIDDGSKDIRMSREMLKMEKESGIDTIVCTPHFYIDRDDVDSFIRRRDNAYEQLLPFAEEIGIELVPGAEVYFSSALSECDLRRLCIKNTDYMMLELPYQALNGSFRDKFRTFMGEITPDIRPILAHVERYLLFSDKSEIYEILDSDVLVQLNSGSFKSFSKELRFMLELIKGDNAHLIGTDCHNTTSRPPNMEQAKRMISKKLSEKDFVRFTENAYKVLDNEHLI